VKRAAVRQIYNLYIYAHPATDFERLVKMCRAMSTKRLSTNGDCWQCVNKTGQVDLLMTAIHGGD
jgi:hypothetical protein